ncbi:hypothetical protein IFM89_014388 [Coptis chinensis]|uniref:SP-RING-type domain-containing protein n=1 Tax=Coptis chinensis TaxID=261450 RepID=A0A835LDP5_9MAGN|nr:hypothetical protein IFM89_014388 [Coptis chinensis]
MATTSATRIRNAATTLYDDNQSLITEIRKFMSTMKGIAVDLEKENQHEMVKGLENGVVELLGVSDECTYLSSAIDSVKNNYQPTDEATDFEKLFEEEIAKIKAGSNSVTPQKRPFLRQFKEAIWNVHHAGQLMPGDEQEDIVMTSTESTLLNVTCPLSGKPVINLQDPVRSLDCKHIYAKKEVMHFIKTKKPIPLCPVAGCPKILQAGKVVCDPLLLIEIDEARTTSNQNTQPAVIEDITEQD